MNDTNTFIGLTSASLCENFHEVARPLTKASPTASFGREQLYRELGAKIRLFREKKGMTQGELAEGVGLTRTSLTNIEKGRQKILLHTLMDFSEVLAVDAKDLLPSVGKAYDPLGKVTLKSALPPAHREFVERALNPATSYDAKSGN